MAVLKLRGAVKARIAAAALIAGSVLVGASAQAADDLRVRFSWKNKGEYGHMYFADAKGIYKKHGLNVRMGEGAGSQAALGALIQGQEDVVIMPAIFALSAIQAGMPVRIIAIHHPRTPVVLISHPEKPIAKPSDLEGKTVAHAVGETGTSYLDTFCKINKVDCSKVRRVTMNAQARVQSFLEGKVDTVSVYRTNDLPIVEQRTKKEFPVLDLAEHGLIAPGLSVVAADSKIKSNPDVLKRYLAALGEAIKATKADPAAAAQAMKDAWPGGPDVKIIEAQVKATMDAVPEREGKPIGWIDEAELKAALELVATEEKFGKPKAPSAYYTNELLSR